MHQINSATTAPSRNSFLNNQILPAQTSPSIFVQELTGGCQNSFLNALRCAGICDENGELANEKSSFHLPYPNTSQQEIVHKLLNSPVTFAIPQGRLEFPLRELLEDLCKNSSGAVARIAIKGGFVRQLIVSSKEYCISASNELGFTHSESEELISEELLSCHYTQLNDVDICFELNPGFKPEDITGKIPYFIGNKLMNASLTQIEKGFLKFKIIKDPLKSHKKKEPPKTLKPKIFPSFALACFGSLDISFLSGYIKSEKLAGSAPIEILAIEKLPRNYLFTSDAILLDITPLIASASIAAKPVRFKSYYKNDLQPFIDLLSKKIRIVEPETINESGFPDAISYFTRGFECIEHLNILAETFLKVPQNISKEIEKCLKNHHHANPDSVIAFMVNLMQHFPKQIEFDFEPVWKMIGLKKEEIQSPVPVILFEALIEYKIPFEVVSAMISIAALFVISATSMKEQLPAVAIKKQEHSYYLQIRAWETAYLLLPFNPLDSFTIIKTYISKSKKKEKKILAELFQKIIMLSFSTIDGASILTANKELISSSYQKLIKGSEELFDDQEPLLKYVAYHLNLTLREFGNNDYWFLHNFSEIIRITPKAWIKSLVYYLKKGFTKESYQLALNLIDNEHLYKKDLIFFRKWPSALAKSGDEALSTLAVQEFNKLSKSGFDIQNALGLIDSLLPQRIYQGQLLILELQKNRGLSISILEESTAIAKLLSLFSSFSRNVFLLQSMVSILENFINALQNTKIPPWNEEFETQIGLFVENLFKEKKVELAKKIIELIGKFHISTQNMSLSLLLLRSTLEAQKIKKAYKYFQEIIKNPAWKEKACEIAIETDNLLSWIFKQNYNTKILQRIAEDIFNEALKDLIVNLNFLSEYPAKALKLFSVHPSPSPDVKEIVINKIILSKKNINLTKKIGLFEKISLFTFENKEGFYIKITEFIQAASDNVGYFSLLQRAFLCLLAPYPKSPEFWGENFIKILESAKPFLIELIWEFLKKTLVENRILDHHPVILYKSWLAIIQTFRRLNDFGHITPSLIKQLLLSDGLSDKNVKYPLELETCHYMIESKNPDFFEFALSILNRQIEEKQFDHLSAPIFKDCFFKLIENGCLHENTGAHVHLIVKKVINLEILIQKDLFLIVPFLLKYQGQQTFETASYFLIDLLIISNETKRNSFPGTQTQLGDLLVCYFEKIKKFKHLTSPINPILLRDKIKSHVSQVSYSKLFYSMIINEIVNQYKEETLKDYVDGFSAMESIFPDVQYSQNALRAWVEASAKFLGKIAGAPNEWITFTHKVKSCFDKIKLLENQSQKINANNEIISAEKIESKHPKKENNYRFLFPFTKYCLLNALLDHKFQSKNENHLNIFFFFKYNFPLSKNFSKEEKRLLAVLLEKFLFWRPIDEDFASHLPILQYLQEQSYKSGYFKDCPGIEIKFYFYFKADLPACTGEKLRKIYAASLTEFIEKFVNYNTTRSLTHAIAVLWKFRDLLRGFPEKIKSCTELLIDRVSENAYLETQNKPIFYWLGHSIFGGECKLFLYQKRFDKECAYYLAKLLFEKFYALIKQEAESEEGIKKSALMVPFLIPILASVAKKGGFASDYKQYFKYQHQLVDYLQQALEKLDKDDDKVIERDNVMNIIGIALLESPLPMPVTDEIKHFRLELFSKFFNSLNMICNGKFDKQKFELAEVLLKFIAEELTISATHTF